MSEKDKKLLLILVVVLILVLPFIGLFLPFRNMNRDIAEKVQGLQQRVEYLSQIETSSQFYQTETEKYQQGIEELSGRLPDDIRQEDILLFMNRAEELLPVTMNQASFTENASSAIEGEEQTAETAGGEETAEETQTAEENLTADEQLTKGAESADASAENTTDGYPVTDKLTGITTGTQISYECSYDSFKKLVNYVEQYQERMTISDITAVYQDGIVQGSLKLNQYALAGRAETKQEKTPKQEGSFIAHIDGQRLGTSNIFVKGAGTSADTPIIANPDEMLEGTTFDYFLLLSNAESDIPGKIIGRAKDSAGTTYLRKEDNTKQAVSITFEGKDGSYTASYAIGDTVYPAAGETKETADMGDTLEFAILSSPRVGAEDSVAADVSLINKTDMPLHVKVLNDDTEEPRVSITGKTGKIVMD